MLRQAIAERAEPLYSLRADPEREVTVTRSPTVALVAALTATAKPSGEVITCGPCADADRAAFTFVGICPRLVVFPQLREVLGGRPQTLVLNAAYDAEELRHVASLCLRGNVRTIQMGGQGKQAHSSPGVSLPTLSGMRDRTIIVGGREAHDPPQQGRVGWLIASPTWTNTLRRVLDQLF